MIVVVVVLMVGYVRLGVHHIAFRWFVAMHFPKQIVDQDFPKSPIFPAYYFH